MRVSIDFCLAYIAEVAEAATGAGSFVSDSHR